MIRHGAGHDYESLSLFYWASLHPSGGYCVKQFLVNPCTTAFRTQWPRAAKASETAGPSRQP
ncbi:MAG: hypothetical protein Unbinned400contig1002_39 [Prokaryotic dsDNA virus sp.]|nr:MAG: hypothetical protein Unbinned400contig1002_39 [Prokaryotic dsDNA virus sp.]